MQRRVPVAERALGSLRLLRDIGSGHVTTAYLARDAGGRLVVAKRLHPDLARDARCAALFRAHAGQAAPVVHPNVCRVHGVEEHGGALVLLEEYVHGESLAALLEALARGGGSLAPEVAAHLVAQACLGLHALHQVHGADGAPLVHGEVEPRTLLVTYDGEVKLEGGGLAALAARLPGARDPRFTAPELAAGAAPDVRADVFSLGAVLHAALGVGAGGGAAAAGLDALAGRSTAARPERPASAAELYRELYEYLAGRPRPATVRLVGDLLHRVFARRYAAREEVRLLAFAAPEVLEDEELGATAAPAPAPQPRCDFCGVFFAAASALAAHAPDCSQRRWWERNFGPERLAELGPAVSAEAGLPGTAGPALTSAVGPAPGLEMGLWQALRARLGERGRDPLVARIEAVEARLAAVRDPRARALAERALAALWSMAAALDGHGLAADLLAGIRPELLGCANAVLAVALEVEANAAYLAHASARELGVEMEALRARAARTTTPELRRQLDEMLATKAALLTARERLAEATELLQLRLEAMADRVRATHAKVLRIAASPVLGDPEAQTQIAVFFDSLAREVATAADSVEELEATLAAGT